MRPAPPIEAGAGSSRRARRAVALAALSAAALLGGAPARAGDPAGDVAARARDVLSDKRFQTEHPARRQGGSLDVTLGGSSGAQCESGGGSGDCEGDGRNGAGRGDGSEPRGRDGRADGADGRGRARADGADGRGRDGADGRGRDGHADGADGRGRDGSGSEGSGRGRDGRADGDGSGPDGRGAGTRASADGDGSDGTGDGPEGGRGGRADGAERGGTSQPRDGADARKRGAVRERVRRPRDPDRPREVTRRPPDTQERSDAAGVFGLLLKVLLGVGIALAVVFLVSLLMRPRKPIQPDPAAGEAGPAPPRPLPAPSEIDALAAAGRYTEAIHAMLLLAVAHLCRRGSLTLSDDMTAREALRSVSGDDPGRRALGDLVLAVEISLFGGRELGRDDYDRCAAAFRQITARPEPPAAAAEPPPPAPAGGPA